MLLGYRYKLKPWREQTLNVLRWIDMLRANYVRREKSTVFD